MIRAVLSTARRIVASFRPMPPAPAATHVPPAHCRKSVHDRAWTWPDCTAPHCTCADAAMVERAMPVKHRDLYAERFDVEG